MNRADSGLFCFDPGARMIENWHIVICGFLQDEATGGMPRMLN